MGKLKKKKTNFPTDSRQAWVPPGNQDFINPHHFDISLLVLKKQIHDILLFPVDLRPLSIRFISSLSDSDIRPPLTSMASPSTKSIENSPQFSLQFPPPTHHLPTALTSFYFLLRPNLFLLSLCSSPLSIVIGLHFFFFVYFNYFVYYLVS